VELLDIAGRGAFGDATMETLMDKLFEPRRNVVCVKPTRLGVVTDGVIALEKPDLINLFEGISSEFVLIPFLCNGMHWCSIMARLSTSEVFYYDPMLSSFGDQAKAVHLHSYSA
ncbi:hypothetical protein L917_02978, partial [Phytophthora nicotianae]